MRAAAAGLTAIVAAVVFATAAGAQTARGALVANGQRADLGHAIAVEIDSTTEPGYLDVVVVASDRPLTAAQARDRDGLEAMARRGDLAALRVVIDPDARVKSAAPLHRAFTTFVSSALWIRWTPTAYDEKRVAGRFATDGTVREFRQAWSYDVTFEAPVVLDPAAKSVPRK